MKKFWPLITLVFGLLLLVSSFLFGVLIVGIPGPDDSAAESTRQAVLGYFAMGGAILGALCMLIGIIGGLICLIRR